jgi:hypothetical protein
MLIILDTQEAEIRRIAVPNQPRQIVCVTLSGKKYHRKRAGEVAQGIGPEFKPQYGKKKTAFQKVFPKKPLHPTLFSLKSLAFHR